MLSLSIIIIHYNQAKWLENCLMKIRQEKLDIPFEVIVIDNNSPDILEAEKMVEKMQDHFAELVLIKNQKNLGYGQAVNQGIKATDGKYILVLNPDVLISGAGLSKMVKYMEENQSVGVLGPKLFNYDGTLQYSCFAFPKWYTPIVRRTFLGNTLFGKKEIRRYLMEDYDHQVTREVDWLLGGALFLRREAIEKIGLMDERYFLYCEDTDCCRKFKDSIYKVIYYPEASFLHYHQRMSARKKGLRALFDKIALIHIMSAIKYFLKWGI